MKCPAYKTETVTREVFNNSVCSRLDTDVFVVFPDGSKDFFSFPYPQCSRNVEALLLRWLQSHIDADRLTRKESNDGPDA